MACNVVFIVYFVILRDMIEIGTPPIDFFRNLIYNVAILIWQWVLMEVHEIVRSTEAGYVEFAVCYVIKLDLCRWISREKKVNRGDIILYK